MRPPGPRRVDVDREARSGVALPDFGFVAVHESPLADGVAGEQAWLARAVARGQAAAVLWQGAQGFVVPRSYERRPHWARACAAAAARGWPVQVRASGGGLVPQGPGLWNLTLGWAAGSATPADATPLYRAFTQALADALARLGVPASAQAVQGSFCDGRFNLASGGRKLVGTAQAWRRVDGVPTVLLHAVIVVDADPQRLTESANRFEVEAGEPLRYRAEALTSVVQAWRDAHDSARPPDDLPQRCLQAVAERFARAIPPRAGLPATLSEEIPWS